MKTKTKKKNYSLIVTAVCRVVVMGAEDEAHAKEIAQDQLFTGDFEIDECSDVEAVPDEGLESAKRYANEVLEDDDLEEDEG